MILVILLSLCLSAYSGDIPPEWVKRIVRFALNFKIIPSAPIEISLCAIYKKMGQTPLSYLVPQIILWSPQEQFSITLHCPKCSKKYVIQPSGWRDGNSNRLIPRRVHGIHSFLLLVPFCLWHKTRATQKVLILIQSMLATGCSINSVTTMLLQRRYSAYAKKINVVKKVSVQFLSFEEWSGHSPSIAPTRHFVSVCYLLQFWEREGLYCRHMQELSINQ